MYELPPSHLELKSKSLSVALLSSKWELDLSNILIIELSYSKILRQFSLEWN